MNNNFLDMTKDIVEKLNTLNDKIIFYYYMKYKNGIFKRCIDINNNFISTKKYFERRKGVKDGDKTKQMIIHFPYYYKMLNLYAHLCAILNVEEKDFCGTFMVTIGNMTENHDNPIKCVESMLSDIDTEDVEYEKRNDKFVNKKKLDRINTEIKVLMRNANNLYIHFKKYGKDEAGFVEECGLEDCMHLVTEFDEKNPTIEPDPDPISSDKFRDEFFHTFGKQMAKPKVHHSVKPSGTTSVFPPATTSFVQPMPDKDSKLKEIRELFAAGLLTKETAEKMVTGTILDHKDPNLVAVAVPPEKKSGLILHKTEEDYKKLQEYSIPIDGESLKRILEATRKK